MPWVFIYLIDIAFIVSFFNSFKRLFPRPYYYPYIPSENSRPTHTNSTSVRFCLSTTHACTGTFLSRVLFPSRAHCKPILSRSNPLSVLRLHRIWYAAHAHFWSCTILWWITLATTASHFQWMFHPSSSRFHHLGIVIYFPYFMFIPINSLSSLCLASLDTFNSGLVSFG